MADDERSQCTTQAEKNETLFWIGMIGIGNQQGMFIKEHRLSFLKRHVVFPPVFRILAVVPFEPQLCHELV